MTRKKIFLIWLFGSILMMLVVSTVSMVIWDFTYDPVPDSDWQPVNNLWNMMLFVPIGWLLSFMTLFGWVNFLFMTVSVYTKWLWLLVGSAIATLAIGGWWPMIYTTMLNN